MPDCPLYDNYLEKKLARMGLGDDDMRDIFGYKSHDPGQAFRAAPTDYTNTIKHLNQAVHIPSVPADQLPALLDEFNYDQLQQYSNLECVRSLNHLSSPNAKLQYPEPYIASPSFIHNDIAFIHVLHYQY